MTESARTMPPRPFREGEKERPLEKKVERPGGAQELLTLHNEWDALDKKENLGVLSLILFVVALVLMALGMEMGSVYLDVNGLFMAIAGVVVGGLEISKRRKMGSLRRKIEELEKRSLGRGGKGLSPGAYEGRRRRF